MRLCIDGAVRDGRALDVRDLELDGNAVVAAIRGEPSTVTVDAPSPKPVHEWVGYVEPGRELSIRPALAAAARSRGISTPQDEQIGTIRDRLDEPDPASVSASMSVQEAKRELAATGEKRDELGERVAELRGRIQELTERGLDASTARAELESAMQELAAVETEQVAARQRLNSAIEAAREERDARDKRMQLEDRVANLERTARAQLVEAIEDDYVSALKAVPGTTAPDTDPFEADAVTAALAIGHIADIEAPIVLDCDRFADPERAASWLGTPVVYL